MKQTAVEWLFDWMGRNQYFIGNDLLKAFEQARAMEKEQKKDAYLQGSFDDGPDVNKAEQYYNETYNK